MYRTSDFDYALPPDLIASHPVEPRDAARLMVLDRAAGTIAHRTFAELDQLMAPGDALVLNTTTVLKARLLGTRDSGAAAEILLLKPLGDGTWEAMVRPGAKLQPGKRVHVAEDFDVEVLEPFGAHGTRRVRLLAQVADHQAIERWGHVPLPPYIARADEAIDEDDYQTVYHDPAQAGSVAAPTAGLHFTTALLDRIAAKAVRRVDIVLHVGAGTFKPVDVEHPEEHVMHHEWYRVSPDAAATLDAVRGAGGRVWAVGTTCVRTLESCWRDGRYRAEEADTNLFIRPPYAPKAVDRVITNFHLPKSTLIMLVAAIAGYDLTMRAYAEAVARGYRFYSYGDAMVIL